MATKIQVRRDSAANWTTANPVLDSGELGFETDTGKVKIGNGSTAWGSLAYVSTDLSSVIAKSIVDAKGDLIVGTAADTVARLAVGTNDLPLIADSTAAGGMKWASLPQASVTNLTTDLAAKWTTANAWTAYTPTIGGTGWALGNGTAAGSYVRIGKTIHFRANIIFGSTSTYGASPLTVSTPATLKDSGFAGAIGVARYFDSSPGNLYIGGFRATSSTAVVLDYASSTAGLVAYLTSTGPFTWASGDYVSISGTFEEA